MDRISVWILGDQLLDPHPALAAAGKIAPRDRIGVVLVESEARKARLPYQRKKLVLLISAMRHYAEELRQAGYQVEVVAAPNSVDGLRGHVRSWQPAHLFTMAAAEYAGRRLQEDRLAELLNVPLTVLPNTQFLVGRHDPHPDATPNQRVVMENFYRAMRRRFKVLMDDAGQPEGGRWNFDRENRKPLPKGGLQFPDLPRYAPDATTQAVMEEVAAFDRGIGAVDGFDLPVTREQAMASFADFLENRLADFGPYEDAMSSRDAVLFHSHLSPQLNIGLLDPLDMVQQAEQAYRAGKASIHSAEGFIRQILGWREYIYWQYWRQMPGLLTANAWRHTKPLPKFFWDGQTDLACLHAVVDRVLATGYSHHIERLMVICNFCMLAGVDPAAVHTWFLSAYVDAYEWVVAPNVIGMGLNADGGKTATKPYIASANYIDKMSDYCAGCRYKPKTRTGADACPFNFLYWNFLLTYEDELRANPRFGPAVLGLRHLNLEERQAVRRQAEHFLREFSP